MTQAVSGQMQRLLGAIGGLAEWATNSPFVEALARPGISDFVFGNPHDLAMPEYVDALARAVQPTGKSHYAYKMSEAPAAAAVAAGLRGRFGLPFAAEDILMTNGNFA